MLSKEERAALIARAMQVNLRFERWQRERDWKQSPLKRLCHVDPANESYFTSNQCGVLRLVTE